MAITRQQAITLGTFHYPGSGKDANKCFVWRRNGSTQTWVTRPAHYRVPVKYGLRTYGYIEAPEMVAVGAPSGDSVFAPADCPVCHGTRY